MNKEIENLIEMALADGEVTEKERAIILRKAEALGEHKDEVEMILDGKIAQLKDDKDVNVLPNTFPTPPIEKKSNKQGDIKKCPSCGAIVQSYTANCEECGHEYRNIGVNSSIKELLIELGAIKKSKYKDEDGDFDEEEYISARAEIVTNFAIPTTKEDLIEFATKSIAEFDTKQIDYEELNSAWESKTTESLSKLQVFSLSDKTIIPILENLEKRFNNKIDKNKKVKRNMIMGLIIYAPSAIFLGYIMYAFIFSLFGKYYWPF